MHIHISNGYTSIPKNLSPSQTIINRWFNYPFSTFIWRLKSHSQFFIFYHFSAFLFLSCNFFCIYLFIAIFPHFLCLSFLLAIFCTLSLPKICSYLFTRIYSSNFFLFLIFFYPYFCLLSLDSFHLYSLAVFELAGHHSNFSGTPVPMVHGAERAHIEKRPGPKHCRVESIGQSILFGYHLRFGKCKLGCEW